MPYNPAQRKRQFQAKFRVSKARRAWAKVAWGTVAMMKYDTPEELAEAEEESGVQPTRTIEAGPTVRLVITKNRTARPMTLDLTMLTEEELRATREVMLLAFDHALESVQLRDQEARDAFTKGDDSFVRLYRPVPEFVVREGTSREHDQSVWDRPEGLPSGGRGLDAGLVRGDGDDVAQLAPPGGAGSQSQDDEPEAD